MNLLLLQNNLCIKDITKTLANQFPASSIKKIFKGGFPSIPPPLTEKWVLFIYLDYKNVTDQIQEAKKCIDIAHCVFISSDSSGTIQKLLLESEFTFKVVNNLLVSVEDMLQYIKDNLKISENLAKRILLKSNKYEPFVVKNVSILSVLDSSDITIKNIDKYLSESNDVSFQYLYWFVMAKEGDYKKVLSLVYKYRDNIHVLCNFLEKRISKEIFLFEEILNGNLSKENYITYAEKNNFPYYILQKTLKLFQILTLEELYAKLFLYRKLKHGNCVEFIMKGCK